MSNSTNTDITDLSQPLQCGDSWQSYAIIGFNLLGIAISLGKQLLNSKKHISLVDILSKSDKTDKLDTESIPINIPDNLKSSGTK